MQRTVSAIVLAGGRSRRFGADKLAATLDGRTLLERAVDAVAEVADEVLVVIAADPVAGSAQAPGQVPSAPDGPVARAAARPGVRIVRDAVPDAGPLAGILAGAWAAHHPTLLVVAGDQPWLVPGVLRLLLMTAEAAARPGVAGARADGVRPRGAILAGEGELLPLPLAASRDAVVETGERLMRAGARSLRGLAVALDALAVPEPAWRSIDPGGRTLRDVDRPEDLAAE